MLQSATIFTNLEHYSTKTTILKGDKTTVFISQTSLFCKQDNARSNFTKIIPVILKFMIPFDNSVFYYNFTELSIYHLFIITQSTILPVIL